MLPRKSTVNITKRNIFNERINELLENTDLKSTNLPKGISIKEINDEFFRLISEGSLKFYDEEYGKEIPNFYLTPERWAEFSKTWSMVDKEKNIAMPFITVQRTGKSKGTYSQLSSTIPQQKLFKYTDSAELDGDYIIYKKYLIPQPTPIDLTYSVKLFTKYQKMINKFDELYFFKYSSIQQYLNVKGHYFVTQIEEANDIDEQQDINKDKFYVSEFIIRTKAYFIKESEFKVVETKKFSRITMSFE